MLVKNASVVVPGPFSDFHSKPRTDAAARNDLFAASKAPPWVGIASLERMFLEGVEIQEESGVSHAKRVGCGTQNQNCTDFYHGFAGQNRVQLVHPYLSLPQFLSSILLAGEKQPAWHHRSNAFVHEALVIFAEK